jgi:hypothetical protein
VSTGETMTSAGAMTGAMLRWYPARWRDRYGAELSAMIEDDLGGRRPTVSYRWAIARSGLNERLRDAGLLGDSVPPAERVRGGALIVLCAFALFVIPGVAFAKISEHWDQSIHRGPPRHLPAVFFNLLGSLAVACGVAVALAALALLLTFVKFVRAGGWPAIRRASAHGDFSHPVDRHCWWRFGCLGPAPHRSPTQCRIRVVPTHVRGCRDTVLGHRPCLDGGGGGRHAPPEHRVG